MKVDPKHELDHAFAELEQGKFVPSSLSSHEWVRCWCDDPAMQKRCPMYQERRYTLSIDSKNYSEEIDDYCLFNYDDQDCLDNRCHYPGIVGLLKRV